MSEIGHSWLIEGAFAALEEELVVVKNVKNGPKMPKVCRPRSVVDLNIIKENEHKLTKEGS